MTHELPGFDIEKLNPDEANKRISDAREMFVRYFARHKGAHFPQIGATGGHKRNTERALATIDNGGRLAQHESTYYGVFGDSKNIRIWPFAQGGFLMHVWGQGKVAFLRDGSSEEFHSEMYKNDKLLLLTAALLPEDMLSGKAMTEVAAHLYDHKEEKPQKGFLAKLRKSSHLPELPYQGAIDGDMIHVQWSSREGQEIMGPLHSWTAVDPMKNEMGKTYVPLLRVRDPEVNPIKSSDQAQIVNGVVRVDPFVYKEPPVTLW